MSSSHKKSDTPESSPDQKTSPVRQKPQEGVRETVEAVAIAFILAFVFKTFEAEAFVIPTGSMAPTLYGRHKEVKCSGCGLDYTIGASQEIDQDSGVLHHEGRLRSSVCPNCRHENDVFESPVFNGDRIVVNKQVSKYRRFDVVVFKNPEEPHVNYIKRLVGLPGETVRIRQGDIQARRSEADPWVVQRKEDPDRQRDIQLLLYDDQHPPVELLKAGAEERWAPASWNEAATDFGGWPLTKNSWTADAESRTYSADAADEQVHWLRYRHLIPTADEWRMVAEGGKLEKALQPQLIGDFCGFNVDSRGNSRDDELYWINDLTLDCHLRIDSSDERSQFWLELVEGRRTVRCQISPATGMAEIIGLTRADGQTTAISETIATVPTSVKGAGEYDLTFADVDDRLCLWINGGLIPLGEKGEFPPEDLNLPSNLDLAPAGIAIAGMKATVSQLKIHRDIYYRNDILNFERTDGISADPGSDEYRRQYSFGSITVNEVDSSYWTRLTRSLRDPGKYASEYAELTRSQEAQFGKNLEFKLNDDEYLMFGDNSPASKDSRLFDYYSRPLRGVDSHRYAVREKDLIGEALCIFWPHGIPFLNNGKGYSVLSHRKYERTGRVSSEDEYPLYSVPFYPNVSRMKMIR